MESLNPRDEEAHTIILSPFVSMGEWQTAVGMFTRENSKSKHFFQSKIQSENEIKV